MKKSKTLFHNPSQFCALFILLTLSSFSVGEDFEEGDFCFAGYEGTCLAASKCMDLPARMDELGLRNSNVGNCGFTVVEEMICCPNSPAPVQTPSAGLDSFKPFEFRPPSEDEINMSSTTVLPLNFWFSPNFINQNNNNIIEKNLYKENQEHSSTAQVEQARTDGVNRLFHNIFHNTKAQSVEEPTADEDINESSTQISKKNPIQAEVINDRLNQFFNIKPLPKENAKEKKKPLFNEEPVPKELIDERLNKFFNIKPLPKEDAKEKKKPLFNEKSAPKELIDERLNKLFNINSFPKESADERKKPTANANPLPPEIVNKRVEGIFNGIFESEHEDENNASVADELVKERIKNLFNTNLTPNDLPDEIVNKRINEIFYNDNNFSGNNKHFLPNENQVSEAVIKERLDSILNAKPITNPNRNGASNNIPNKGRVNTQIKPLTRLDFIGIDGERPPPNNKSASNGDGQPNGKRVLHTYKNITCETKHYKGTCTGSSKCLHLNNYLKKLKLKESDVEYCAEVDTICCPKIERAAERACRALESIPTPHVISHIYGGYRVGPTEYRHMANIVYDIEGPFCGGTLIHKRFVLTAAHCILARNAKPTKVILGIADFNNEEEKAFRQVIDIKTTHVHEKYKSIAHYYDIGLLELAEDVAYSVTVYPTCLHTDQTELPDGIELTVTGWGRTENQFHSEHLLAVKLNHIPILQCNQSYESSIDPLHLNHGIDETQICAGAPGKDACVGDSGGPMHLVVDPAHNKYRVVGVVSFGLSCGSTAPGVYTRVTEFLDFIEKIVWPAEMEA